MTEPKSLDEKIQTVDRDESRSLKEKMALLIVSVLLFIAVGVIGILAWQLSLDRDEAQAVAASEQTQKQEIAQEAQAVICTAADVEVYDEALCARLDAASKEPSAQAAGPRGDKGDPGRDGRDGKDSTVPGPVGLAGRDGVDGRDGLDSLIQGPQGLPGNDSLIPGPMGPPGIAGAAGADGKDGAPGKDGLNGKDGANGLNGAPGLDGRGIADMQCIGTGETSYVLVTFTDGGTTTWDGPCRLAPFIAPTPQPTEAP